MTSHYGFKLLIQLPIINKCRMFIGRFNIHIGSYCNGHILHHMWQTVNKLILIVLHDMKLFSR
jgi:hypothetical protein